MGLIGIIGIAAGAVAAPFDPVAMTLLMVSVTLFLLFAGYLALVVAPYAMILSKVRCPACRRRSLTLVRIILFNPPLASFHTCKSCGTRHMRRLTGRWQPCAF
jgi:hypothetical protein